MWSILKMFYTYKEGECSNRKPWEDKTLIATVVSFLATAAAKYWGMEISAEEQAGFVAVIVVLFRLISPSVGIKPEETKKPKIDNEEVEEDKNWPPDHGRG